MEAKVDQAKPARTMTHLEVDDIIWEEIISSSGYLTMTRAVFWLASRTTLQRMRERTRGSRQ